MKRALASVLALATARFFPAYVCGLGASAWLDGDAKTARALADELVAFEAEDDRTRATPSGERFAGEWALVTHQMIALGLAQIVLAHPEERDLISEVTRAAMKSFGPEMRDFGTRAWGEDALATLASEHGHAYMGYPALAISMARSLDPAFPAAVARQHDALIAAFERRLLASPTGLIETYPGEAYPTDVASIAAAIAVHGRATGKDHGAVISHWRARVRAAQIDRASGFVIQRMDATSGRAHDAPRGSGTGLAAYYAGFVDRGLHRELADALARHEARFMGFGAIREYPDGYTGAGDIDSGPVLFGVSVSATGFALAPLRALGREDEFRALYRTTDLFGVPMGGRFTTGGPIGNALLLAFLTSGPELAK